MSLFPIARTFQSHTPIKRLLPSPPLSIHYLPPHTPLWTRQRFRRYQHRLRFTLPFVECTATQLAITVVAPCPQHALSIDGQHMVITTCHHDDFLVMKILCWYTVIQIVVSMRSHMLFFSTCPHPPVFVSVILPEKPHAAMIIGNASNVALSMYTGTLFLTRLPCLSPSPHDHHVNNDPCLVTTTLEKELDAIMPTSSPANTVS